MIQAVRDAWRKRLIDWRDVCLPHKTNNTAIPAKAGIQLFQSFLDAGLCRHDK
ncbi:MAG TPA: hypothetical protein PLV50_13505 [Smithella sp.]|nr:hypothetical protein [Smithella sp.]HOG91553.1 hypothetical protein [Smithella sp.]